LYLSIYSFNFVSQNEGCKKEMNLDDDDDDDGKKEDA
jgi:hypothetical protein